jgi:hypothetical protein
LKRILWLAALAAIGHAQILGPYSASANFTADLFGPVDTRPGCWGNAESATWELEFYPPPGYRVRILAIDGDLVAWPKVLPEDDPVAEGTYAGVLLGFQVAGPDGSVRCDYCADNTMVYVQSALDSHPAVRSFSRNTAAAGLLAADNKLYIKVASWLNTFGLPVHLEPTFDVLYQFEPDSAPVPAKMRTSLTRTK